MPLTQHHLSSQTNNKTSTSRACELTMASDPRRRKERSQAASQGCRLQHCQEEVREVARCCSPSPPCRQHPKPRHPLVRPAECPCRTSKASRSHCFMPTPSQGRGCQSTALKHVTRRSWARYYVFLAIGGILNPSRVCEPERVRSVHGFNSYLWGRVEVQWFLLSPHTYKVL